MLAEYDISDRGGVEILVQACLSLDRAEECADQINVDGPTIMTKSGMREHPLLKNELANRAFVCRSLQRLGLNLEVVKPTSRSPVSLAMTTTRTPISRSKKLQGSPQR